MSQPGWSIGNDGGFNAIRGFAFQFDATLLEIFANPNRAVGIEGDQDIEVENFYIQVKIRSGSYYPSAIAPAIKQILGQFSNDHTRRYRLYCHFEDRKPGDHECLDSEKLEKILGDQSVTFTGETKKLFLDRFEIAFADNFLAQFESVLKLIQGRYHLKTLDEAVAYHAILNHHITSLVLTKPAGARVTSLHMLDDVAGSAEQSIFQGGYQNRLGKDRYIKMLRRQVQRRSPNQVFKERLVSVEVGSNCHAEDLIDFADATGGRFCVRKNSPAPYLLLRGSLDVREFKRELWDRGLKFVDGTNFDGDRFRIGDLTGPPKDAKLRIIEESRLPDLVNAVKVHEVYDFYLTRPMGKKFPTAKSVRMMVDSVEDAVKIFAMGARA
jgi:hypothetical protein